MTSQSVISMMMLAKPRRRRKEARPDEIIRAALTVFARSGFTAARLDDVAAEAGVSKGTLYLYFPSKEELFKAVVRAAVLPNLARAERAAAGHRGSQAELLRRFLELIGRRILRSRLSVIPKLVLAEAATFPDLARFYLETVVHRAMALIGGILRRGIASGEFRAVPVEPAVLSLISPVLFLALWRHSFAPVAPRPIDELSTLRAHLDLALHGLQPRDGDGHAR